MKRFLAVSATLAIIGITETRPAAAQFGRGGAEWVTNGSDAQRSFSIPTDSKITPEGMRKPGFQFLWKLKLNNEAVQLNSLTPAVLMDRYIGYRGFRSFAFVGGSGNTAFGIDSDLARIDWQVHLPEPEHAGSSVACAGGLTSAIARSTSASYPPAGAGGGGLGGRGGHARSGVGAPGEGAVTIAPALAAAASAAAAPQSGGRGRGGAQTRPPAVIYLLGAEGNLHLMYISNGQESGTPIKFLPADANAQGLTVIDDIAYAATPGCNGSPSGVWALDIASRQVTEWHSSAGTVAGSAGPAFGPDGTIYVSTTAGEMLSLDPRSLTVKDNFTTSGQALSSSPVVFAYKEKTIVAVATRDGRILLLDAASLGGADHRTPLFTTPAYSPDSGPSALASVQAMDGSRWLLAAGTGTKGTLAAWRLAEQNGRLSLQQAWVSEDMISPLTPMVINGVVFAISSGEYHSTDPKMTAAQRAQKSSPAILYALDLNTGKSVWDSGKTITSFVHSGGLSGGASQIYLETWDQTIYAFGYPIEH